MSAATGDSPSESSTVPPAATLAAGSTAKVGGSSANSAAADEGAADPDHSWSESSTYAGARTGSEASMSDLASSHGGSTPRRAEAAAPLALPQVRARWSDLSDGLVTSDALEEDDFEDVSSVASPTSSPKKNSRRTTRRRRKREIESKLAEACDNAQLPAGDVAQATAASHMPVAHGGSRHVVTFGDIGMQGSVTSEEAAMVAGGLISPSRMRAGGTATAPDFAMYRPSLRWEVPGSPCHAQAGAAALMSTRPTLAGIAPNACEASARVPNPERCLDVAGSTTCTTVGPATFLGSKACANSGAVAQDASSRSPIAIGMVSPVKASRPQLPTGAMAAHWPSAMPENPWLSPASPSRPRGVAGPACGIVSTSPLSPAGAGHAHLASPWSSAGTPTADALRSLLRGAGGGITSNAELAAQLQAAAPDTYED